MILSLWERSYHCLSGGYCYSLKVPRDFRWGPPEAEHPLAPPPPPHDSQSARLGHPQKFQHHSYHCPKKSDQSISAGAYSWHLCDKKYWRIRDTGLGCLCWDSVRFDILPFLIILTLLSWPIMAILESLRQQIYLYTVCHSTRKFPITAEHDLHAETGDICFCLSKQNCQKNIQRW